MKGDEYKGYYCLLIAILCNLNAAEASTMYEYGPDHPLCRKKARQISAGWEENECGIKSRQRQEIFSSASCFYQERRDRLC